MTKRANAILGFIKRGLSSRSREVILDPYAALASPSPEYRVQFLCPCFKKDVEILERGQRRTTRMIQEPKNKLYNMRFKELNLFSFSKRRLRGDLITFVQVLNTQGERHLIFGGS